MSQISLTTAIVASKQAQVQFAAASKIAKMNAASERAVADLVEAGRQNLNVIANAAPAGTGSIIDVSV